MTAFILTYRNGAREAITSDLETCELMSNQVFGLDLEQAREFGANVEFAEAGNTTFTEAEFLQADPDKELVKEQPVGEPTPEFQAELESGDGSQAVSEGAAEQNASVQIPEQSVGEASKTDTEQTATVALPALGQILPKTPETNPPVTTPIDADEQSKDAGEPVTHAVTDREQESNPRVQAEAKPSLAKGRGKGAKT